jgi:hypothetical protein
MSRVKNVRVPFMGDIILLPLFTILNTINRLFRYISVRGSTSKNITFSTYFPKRKSKRPREIFRFENIHFFFYLFFIKQR